MEIQQHLERGVLLVSLSGECDHQEVRNFQAVISNALLAGHRRILVDLAWLEFLDSTGIRCFMEASRDVEKEGGKLVIIRPRALVKKVLGRLELSRALPIFDSAAEARAFLGPAT